MKTLLLTGLVGVAALLPSAAFAGDSAPGDIAPATSVPNNVQNPDQHRVVYDNGILMNDDRVIAGRSVARSGSSTYQGHWDGAYQEDGTYHGEWQGSYRDADGRVYDGQYAGTFIGEGNPAQMGATYAGEYAEEPVSAGTDYAAPRYQEARPQYARAPDPRTPVPEYRAPAPYPQYQTQYRYPSGWQGGYYPGGTTIVIQSAPGTTTTTTYYED